MNRAEIECPRCTAAVPGDQDWCLKCGQAARTRILKAPNWRLPTALMALVIAVSIGALAFSFVRLTEDPAPPRWIPQPTVTTLPAAPADPAAPTTPTP
ncbi:MAG TPA: hypothetical protein VNT22_05195 [Baekduia sp.]|nr:hypothetical protein [Baekduia sp.]